MRSPSLKRHSFKTEIDINFSIHFLPLCMHRASTRLWFFSRTMMVLYPCLWAYEVLQHFMKWSIEWCTSRLRAYNLCHQSVRIQREGNRDCWNVEPNSKNWEFSSPWFMAPDIWFCSLLLGSESLLYATELGMDRSSHRKEDLMSVCPEQSRFDSSVKHFHGFFIFNWSILIRSYIEWN